MAVKQSVALAGGKTAFDPDVIIIVETNTLKRGVLWIIMQAE